MISVKTVKQCSEQWDFPILPWQIYEIADLLAGVKTADVITIRNVCVKKKVRKGLGDKGYCHGWNVLGFSH